MNSFLNFMSGPLWFTLPLAAIYLGLLAYLIYLVWHNRKDN